MESISTGRRFCTSISDRSLEDDEPAEPSTKKKRIVRKMITSEEKDQGDQVEDSPPAASVPFLAAVAVQEAVRNSLRTTPAKMEVAAVVRTTTPEPCATVPTSGTCKARAQTPRGRTTYVYNCHRW